MLTNTDTQINKILQGYSIESLKALSQYKNIDAALNKQMEATMMAHLPLANIVTIKAIDNAGRAGLALSFQGKMAQAKQAYTIADEIIRTSSLSNEASLIVKNNFNASKGYYDYRQKNNESAKANILIALESCTILINEYGYNFLQERPIHLVCNLVKVEACSSNYEKAIKIACYLIGKMRGNCNNSLDSDISLLKSIQHLSLKNESFLLTQVFEEVAKLLASCSEDESNNFVFLASNLLKYYNLSLDKQLNREETWFKNKQLLAQGKIVEFLEESSKFIAEGRGSCKLLWHATVLDVLKICQNIDSEISEKLQKKITEDFSKYKYLPSVLKV